MSRGSSTSSSKMVCMCESKDKMSTEEPASWSRYQGDSVVSEGVNDWRGTLDGLDS